MNRASTVLLHPPQFKVVFDADRCAGRALVQRQLAAFAAHQVAATPGVEGFRARRCNAERVLAHSERRLASRPVVIVEGRGLAPWYLRTPRSPLLAVRHHSFPLVARVLNGSGFLVPFDGDGTSWIHARRYTVTPLAVISATSAKGSALRSGHASLLA